MDHAVFHHNWKLVHGRREVETALKDMACAVERMSHPKRPLVLISLLKGGLWTGYQLLFLLEERFPGRFHDIRVGHLGISSYGDQTKPGGIKITHTLDLDVKDLERAIIWIVDDIWDTGKTMETACDRVRRLGGIDIQTCVLVFRCEGAAPDFPHRPNVWGFKYEGKEFFAGCGMGIGEQHRHHPELYVEKSRL